MSNDVCVHRVALERWRTAFDAYLKAANARDRSEARDELAKSTVSAECALEYVKYDVAVPNDKNENLHGLAHVVPWVESRICDVAGSKAELVKVETLSGRRTASFGDALIAMLDEIILELRDRS
jgi:hypothetical protein